MEARDLIKAIHQQGPRLQKNPEPGELAKGDLPGHEFHGNQHTGGSGGGGKEKSTPQIDRAVSTLTASGVPKDKAMAYARSLREMTGEADMKSMSAKDLKEDYALHEKNLKEATTKEGKTSHSPKVMDTNNRDAGSGKLALERGKDGIPHTAKYKGEEWYRQREGTSLGKPAGAPKDTRMHEMRSYGKTGNEDKRIWVSHDGDYVHED